MKNPINQWPLWEMAFAFVLWPIIVWFMFLLLFLLQPKNIDIKRYSECIEVWTCYNDWEAIKTLEYCNFMLSHWWDKDCTNLCK
jgi:hypothetical protein